MNGFLVINKEKEFTSHDVVAIVKGLTPEKHVGHTGTLDPNATGVLPIAFGYTTRLIEYLDQAPKKYIAKGLLGYSSDTQDVWGNVIKSDFEGKVQENDLTALFPLFLGEIEQLPSKYSAVRVNGRHLYSYAHAGEKVEIPVRKVVVYSITLLYFDYITQEFEIEVCCGRGTYIRSIINDLGEKLGCGAVMTELQRTSACGFDISDALDLNELRKMSPEEVESHILPMEKAVSFMNRVDITDEQKKDFNDGKHLKVHQGSLSSDELVCVFCNNLLSGVGTWDNPNRIKPVKVFIR